MQKRRFIKRILMGTAMITAITAAMPAYAHGNILLPDTDNGKNTAFEYSGPPGSSLDNSMDTLVQLDGNIALNRTTGEMHLSEKTVYMPFTGNYKYSFGIRVTGLSGRTVTKVESSDQSVVKIYNALNYSENDMAYANAAALKPGKVTITVTAGREYTFSLQVLPYTNPVKTFNIHGYSRRNWKSRFDIQDVASAGFIQPAKQGVWEVTARNGWKITSLCWMDPARNGFNDRSGCFNGSSAWIPLPKMKKGGNYVFRAVLVNTKNGGKVRVTLNILPMALGQG